MSTESGIAPDHLAATRIAAKGSGLSGPNPTTPMPLAPPLCQECGYLKHVFDIEGPDVHTYFRGWD